MSVVLDLVDRSTSCDRTVCREQSVVLCEAVVKRVPVRQWCDAMIPILQPNPAEVAEDEQPTRVRCVEQSVVPGVEPRVYRVCRSFFHRCGE